MVQRSTHITNRKRSVFVKLFPSSSFSLFSSSLLFRVGSQQKQTIICSISRLRHSHNVCTVNYEPYKEMALEEIAL